MEILTKVKDFSETIRRHRIPDDALIRIIFDEEAVGHRSQSFPPPHTSHEEQIRLLNLMPDEYEDDASAELTEIIAESRVNTESLGL